MNKKVKFSGLWTAILSVVSVAYIFPILLVLINSFKKKAYISRYPFAIPTDKMFVGLENYVNGLTKTGFFQAFGWTLFITVFSVAVIVEQICTRIAIMDHGRVIAQGTKEELKQMIKTGETITVEAIALEEKNLRDIRTLEHVFDVQYEKQVLVVRCTDAKHNLIRLLNYLQSQDISFGRVFSELPTLNDVFLEITGKQLRD